MSTLLNKKKTVSAKSSPITTLIESVKKETLLDQVKNVETIQDLLALNEIRLKIRALDIKNLKSYKDVVGDSLKYDGDSDGELIEVEHAKHGYAFGYLLEQPSTCANVFLHSVGEPANEALTLALLKLAIFVGKSTGYTHLLLTHVQNAKIIKVAQEDGWEMLRVYTNKRTKRVLTDISYDL